uniref:Uncharacterized protein n=1 Tax=Lepeophtheirus salmonis TaxID=72036 RepID=A0A0K2U1E4_LEPSM
MHIMLLSRDGESKCPYSS